MKPLTDAHHPLVATSLLALGAGWVAHAAQAAEPEPLDEEFLEYLEQLEGDQDDWTLFEADEVEPVPAKPENSKDKAAQRPPPKTAEVKR